MKISVIITTFNRAKIIAMCLDSLVDQNFPKSDYEIIVVNNNSPDNTDEVMKKYIEEHPDTNIKYYSTTKRGQVYARQTGILESKNEILSFTDDDGILCKDWLKEISKVFEMNREAVGVAGRIRIKWDETPPDWINEYEEQLGKLDYGNEIKYETGLYMNAGNLSIKKDVLIEVGGFNPEMIGDRLIGDGESGLWIRLKKRGLLIGWAPDALMDHYQIVKKNATIHDIKRRFSNNGICIPYNIYAIDRKGNLQLVKNLVNSFKQSMRWSIKKFKYTLKGDKKNKYYAIFRRAFYSAQINYTLKIFFDKDFRNALTKGDWLIKKQTKEILVQ